MAISGSLAMACPRLRPSGRRLRRARSLPTAAFEGSPAPHPCRSLAPHLVRPVLEGGLGQNEPPGYGPQVAVVSIQGLPHFGATQINFWPMRDNSETPRKKKRQLVRSDGVLRAVRYWTLGPAAARRT